MAKVKDEKKMLGVRVPVKTYDQLEELASARGTTVSAQVNQALVQYLTTDGRIVVAPRKE